MKKALILLMMFLSAGLFARDAGDITGLWYGQEDSAGRVPVVEIYEENGLFYAYSFGYKEGDAGLNDDNNPDPQMRGLPLKGLVYLFDLAFSKDSWKGGKIYNPESGKIYYAKASLSDDNNRLNIKATIDGAGLFGKTLTWTRVPASEQNRFTPSAASRPVISGTRKQRRPESSGLSGNYRETGQHRFRGSLQFVHKKSCHLFGDIRPEVCLIPIISVLWPSTVKENRLGQALFIFSIQKTGSYDNPFSFIFILNE